MCVNGGSGMPELSIIVAAYNVERYIDQCLESMFASGRSCGLAYEVIVVNDASSDGTLNHIHNFLQQFPDGIRLIDKPHGGLADTWNYGLDAARGQWVTFIDSDDYVEPGYLPLIKSLIENGSSDVYHLRAKRLGLDGVVTDSDSNSVWPGQGNSRLSLQSCFAPNSPYGGYVWRRVMRRELVEGLGGESPLRFDPDVKSVYDIDWLVRVLSRPHSASFQSASPIVYRLRVSGNEGSQPASALPELEARIALARRMEALFPGEVAHAAWMNALVKAAGLVRRFYVLRDADALRRLRPLWNQVRRVRPKGDSLTKTRRLQIALARLAMALRLSPSVIPASFAVRLSGDNARLVARLENRRKGA